MPDSFGARLRRQREHKQIALVSIAQQTKIHLPLLEGLEDDNVSHWPSGFFCAFLRAVHFKILTTHPAGTPIATASGVGRGGVDTLARLTQLLDTPDGVDLRERGHHVTCPGHPQRRHLALKPLLMRWMVRRHLRVDPAESAVQTARAVLWQQTKRRA